MTRSKSKSKIMTATQLTTRRIEKIWGCHRLGLGFADAPGGGDPVGEIWFEPPLDAPAELLVKYLFTSEKLSVQVHPDDEQARARGHACGKEECWVILDTGPGATIGLGMKDTIDPETLRMAALDGSIEEMLDWKPVAPGDVYYLTAGTVHAIGAGVTLAEVQQNTDLTYRLYDYGRPRDLHLEDGIAVSRPEPWVSPPASGEISSGRAILAEGRKFVLERWRGDRAGKLVPVSGRPLWLVPLAGSGVLDGKAMAAGTVWTLDSPCELGFSGDMLVAYPGGEVASELFPEN